MSLAQIQSLVLHLTVNPGLLDELEQQPELVGQRFGLTTEEVGFARQMSRPVLHSFQLQIANKRMGTRHREYVKRTTSLFEPKQRAQLMLEFLSKHEMRTNTWGQKIPDYLDFLSEKLTDSPYAAILQEIPAFEKWLYTCSLQAEPTGSSETAGYVLSATVQVHAFPFPAEELITGNLPMEFLVQRHGETGYVLGMWTGTQVDLFEIDNSYYELMTRCKEPLSMEELLAVAEEIRVRFQKDRTAQEMVQELLEMAILIPIGEVTA
ncbi:hypothetical protein [Brevibacillus dissolubilis]|uniref:hypothetical protein n=1 Tax=Brevibacillus dissolubilis TaxID=1844116 RepID=UPI0011160037|nr:hypothetical protein [Brevibacillus dissolubilis]